ncbi:MAG TPA: hypothetical protein VNQ73_14340 [Ilumatobacter sp.]|nr:hypothetical protein [Ilumatobacter sp.]
MNTVSTDVSTTIDLAPLLALRVEVDEMAQRLSGGEKPAEAEYLELEQRCTAAESVFRVLLLAAIGDNAEGYRGVDDHLHEVAALITGSLPLDTLAEEVYSVERGDRSLLHSLRLVHEQQGYDQAGLRALLDEFGDELSPEGRAACEAFIAGVAA